MLEPGIRWEPCLPLHSCGVCSVGEWYAVTSGRVQVKNYPVVCQICSRPEGLIADAIARFLIPNRGLKAVDARANTILSLKCRRGIGVILVLHGTHDDDVSPTLPGSGSNV